MQILPLNKPIWLQLSAAETELLSAEMAVLIKKDRPFIIVSLSECQAKEGGRL